MMLNISTLVVLGLFRIFFLLHIYLDSLILIITPACIVWVPCDIVPIALGVIFVGEQNNGWMILIKFNKKG